MKHIYLNQQTIQYIQYNYVFVIKCAAVQCSFLRKAAYVSKQLAKYISDISTAVPFSMPKLVLTV